MLLTLTRNCYYNLPKRERRLPKIYGSEDMDELLILSNSPGEVSGWMEPVARALDKRGAGLSLTAVTLPCPYASGREGAHARTLPGVTDVLTLREANFVRIA